MHGAQERRRQKSRAAHSKTLGNLEGLLNLESKNATKRPVTIGIIGAGPAGLMTALALEAYLPENSAKVIIFDRNKSAFDYPGVEYGIQARACRALERIGQLDAALSGANPATELAFYNSRLDKRFSTVKFDPKYTRTVVRQDFLSDLTNLLKKTQIARQHFVKEISFASDRTATLNGTVEGKPFVQTVDLLIGADGVNSVMRKTLFPGETIIYDRGFSCIYMLIEGTDHTAPDGFMKIANAGRCELVMGQFSTMTMFPLGKGRLALGIGFDHATKEKLWRDNHLADGAEWKDLSARMKKAIAVQLTQDAKFQNGLLVKALDLVPDWDSYKIYLWAMRDTDAIKSPWAIDGNAILLGDAAHAIMPTIGMGASLAIEDAEILASLIAQFIKKNPTQDEFGAGLVSAVFEPFTTARHPVWVDLIHRARRAAIGNFIDVSARKRFAIGPQIPNNALSRIVMGLEWAALKLGI